ncbi:MAG: bifunctional diaminohydroxyphosphoribosylaminopyrimidine deaminase/5-amino-6-(5-phosphoribosylamino)uracil reductase RibD [Gemmatimonadetes bacterium]|nr:bifunctional diaminohydroxyphosphoribosylaminopyrimidine deaminase/5-amino-6-(5-phosphoribosylamino)uracil reductase RibD [Gemmatimonadota bacterium]
MERAAAKPPPPPAPPSDLDRHCLARAVEVGRRGWGRVQPNPMVGAVVVRGGEVIAEAHHAEYGGDHAEVAALASLDDARGATLYTSLEPCSHAGKTPPCTEAIRAAEIARVVFWAPEPGSKQGGGGQWLRSRGVRVDGPFGTRGDWVAENPAFFLAAAGRAPYVALKLAVSLDGMIAPGGGKRAWLTGRESREEVHRLRAGFDAVLVGTRTWKADDPMLTARGAAVPRLPPVPVLLDRRGDLSAGARALQGRSGTRGIVATTAAQAARLQRRLGRSADVVAVPEVDGGLDLAALMAELRGRGMTSVLSEGGGILAMSLLRDDLVDRLYLFAAPVVVGKGGVPAFPAGAAPTSACAADPGAAAESDEAVRLFKGWKSRLDPVRFGSDTLIVLDRGD